MAFDKICPSEELDAGNEGIHGIFDPEERLSQTGTSRSEKQKRKSEQNGWFFICDLRHFTAHLRDQRPFINRVSDNHK